MNGRCVVSWGIDLRKSFSGTTYRAFYQPSHHYNIITENDVVVDAVGIEGRYFKFIPGEQVSVADDGGLIEVQVFRAEARKRRAPVIDRFRNQNKYGIR